MVWNRVLCVICVFGLLKEFRPSESFISPYLNGHWKNFTELEINRDIYPVATYSNLILLIVIFLLTDWLRYKPVILIEGIAGIITWTILPLGQSMLWMQVAQFFYGLFCASELAFYGYLYAKTEKKDYQRATSITKSTLLIGKASSALISQVVVIFNIMDYHQLNYLTLGAMLLGTLWAIFLPPVSQSTYFNRAESAKLAADYELDEANEMGKLKLPIQESDFETSKSKDNSSTTNVIKKKNKPLNCPFKYLLEDFNNSIKNKYILKWCLWWAFSLCGYLQVTYYVQLLWQSIINKEGNNEGVYHGFSNCANCLIETGETGLLRDILSNGLLRVVSNLLRFIWFLWVRNMVFTCSYSDSEQEKLLGSYDTDTWVYPKALKAQGAICTYLIGFLKLKWDVYGEICLAFCAVFQGFLLIYGAYINHLITGYFLYMTFRVLYQMSTTIASAQIAKHIKAESYALVFGVSTFVALLGQSFLTAVVIDTLKLNIRTQFVIYGNYYIAIGAGFLISGIITLVYHFVRKKTVKRKSFAA